MWEWKGGGGVRELIHAEQGTIGDNGTQKSGLILKTKVKLLFSQVNK